MIRRNRHLLRRKIRPVRTLLLPIQEFMRNESFGGILLLTITIIALIWANSPLANYYFDLWHTELGISLGAFTLSHSLHFWINDGLMAIFFFVVGLEIKREILAGELSSPRLAALPIVAAAGGMIFPALIYYFLNAGKDTTSGWGIPTATDIAFAIGVLSLLGSRASLGLKVFLTALAIVDDLGAVLVIAVFYTSEVSIMWLAIGGFFFLGQIILNYSGVRRPVFYALLGAAFWFAFLKSGIHPTIAGVLSAMAIPVRTRINEGQFISKIRDYIHEFAEAPTKPGTDFITTEQMAAIDEIEDTCEKMQPPLQRLEHNLHPWVTYFIMPVFALSNAGVALGGDFFSSYSNSVTLGVMLGLLLGKPIGITLFSYIAVKMKIAQLPSGENWIKILGAGFLGGIGFTMSLFITNLAFTNNENIDLAKVGILSASLIAGIIGYIIIRSARFPLTNGIKAGAASIERTGHN